jgi:UDP-N-acetylmuramoyl-L-alanyl-D-glutamate--2,6-diaminopimelate ligase
MMENLEIISSNCDFSEEITEIVYDSRSVVPRCLFVCLKGVLNDGHDYAEDAEARGAIAIVCENENGIKNYIKVNDTRVALSKISKIFFGRPDESLTTIAVTGTKGKTTTVGFICAVLCTAGKRCASIGTLGAILGDRTIETKNTTPESYEIYKILNEIKKEGFTHVVLEASSIGLAQHRLDGITFDYAIFTNFSKDHIGDNEHKNLDEYFNSKKILFKNCKKAFINGDDARADEIISGCECKYETFGFGKNNGIRAENLKFKFEENFMGTIFFVNGIKFSICVPGNFGVYNALAAICVCEKEGVSAIKIADALSKTKIRGRAEIALSRNGFKVIIDYAHNALSMENVLVSLRKYNPQRLMTLFGAGGCRARDRRFEMGEISGKLSDLSIITEDNSRFEDVMSIIGDIEVGIKKTKGKYAVIPDRRKAIEFCIKNARSGDIIVLAGKGHENYCEIKGKKYHFDEREIIAEIEKELEKT